MCFDIMGTGAMLLGDYLDSLQKMEFCQVSIPLPGHRKAGCFKELIWSLTLHQGCTTSQAMEQLLEPYLHRYDCAFSSLRYTGHFMDFVRGLLSPLDRKSIEPVALHLLGEKSVRPMQ